MSTRSTQLVTFRLGEDHFAADIHVVERVLRYQQPTPLPNCPPWVQGMIEYQDRIVPVIDLRKRFEMPATPVVPETRILIFTVDGYWIATIVDAVLEVTTPLKDEMTPPPPLFRGLTSDYLHGIVRRGERLVIVLDASRLLSTSERLRLDQAVDERLVIERTSDTALTDA